MTAVRGRRDYSYLATGTRRIAKQLADNKALRTYFRLREHFYFTGAQVVLRAYHPQTPSADRRSQNGF